MMAGFTTPGQVNAKGFVSAPVISTAHQEMRFLVYNVVTYTCLL